MITRMPNLCGKTVTGERGGKYHLTEVKGQGAQGVVYAEQTGKYMVKLYYVFYDGTLKPGVSAEKRKSPLSINQGKALTFISVPITRGSETGGGSRSRMRRAEVETAIKELQSILRNDPGKKIGIITFYSAQARALLEEMQKFLDEEQKRLVEVGTVDAFQGKEYDYVILSAVRSNEIENDPQKSVGFLVKPNRLCVAFSRAQRQLIVCGDPNTLQQIEPFDKLMNLCKTGKEGLYREC